MLIESKFVMKKKTGFREDINGLRAWAVCFVILYHFGVSHFSGGFIGVDIFFVISGFLMTGIIVSSLWDGGFSVGKFYLSRARRIVPALLALCVALFIVGWFFLSAKEYEALGVHALGALGFFSNIMFRHESGYFDEDSHEKLLLHTWSLSVEWQFYLILPLVLFAIWKLRPGRQSLVVSAALAFIASLAWSVFMSSVKPAAAFYLLPSRAWEMLAGGLVYLIFGHRQVSSQVQNKLEASGLALIVASVLLFNSASSWPSWRALLPVVGTVLILIAARQGSLWTGSRLAQWLGDCSYSLYLWHWPFAVALVYLQLQDSSVAIIGALALTLLVGQLSYRLIESPARSALARVSFGAGVTSLFVGGMCIGLVSYFIILGDGFHERLPKRINEVFKEADNKNPRFAECHGKTPVPECTYGGKVLGAIVLGDSHAASMVRAVEKALPGKELHILDWTLNSCVTVLGIKDTRDGKSRCGRFLEQALSKQRAFPKHVPLIIINRTAGYIEGPNEPNRVFEASVPKLYTHAPFKVRSNEYMEEMRRGIVETACEFAKTRPVYMVRPIPELLINVPKVMGRGLIMDQPRSVSISLDGYHRRQAFTWETQDIAARRCGVKILDPLPYLCHDGRCWGDVGGLPIYYDDDHLNERGGELLVPMFRQAFGGGGEKHAAIKP